MDKSALTRQRLGAWKLAMPLKLAGITTKLLESAAIGFNTKRATQIITQDDTKITGFTSHGIDRVIGDTRSRYGTRPAAIIDAIKNPTKIKTGMDNQGRPFTIYHGKDARVVINPETGKVVSTTPRTSAGTN